MSYHAKMKMLTLFQTGSVHFGYDVQGKGRHFVLDDGGFQNTVGVAIGGRDEEIDDDFVMQRVLSEDNDWATHTFDWKGEEITIRASAIIAGGAQPACDFTFGAETGDASSGSDSGADAAPVGSLAQQPRHHFDAGYSGYHHAEPAHFSQGYSGQFHPPNPYAATSMPPAMHHMMQGLPRSSQDFDDPAPHYRYGDAVPARNYQTGVPPPAHHSRGSAATRSFTTPHMATYSDHLMAATTGFPHRDPHQQYGLYGAPSYAGSAQFGRQHPQFQSSYSSMAQGYGQGYSQRRTLDD